LGKEAIILAGGLGTRLQGILPEIPKCLAPVAGLPFLTHVIRYLLSQGVDRFIFSLGHKHELVEQFLQDQFPHLPYTCVIELTPLYTGGAIALALEEATRENVFIINGDTLFKADLHLLEKLHLEKQATCTLALKPMENFDRYGVVNINDDGRIIDFREKKHFDHGLINGGVYILRASAFLEREWPDAFSFEKDFLEQHVSTDKFYGLQQDGYFIDIGVPDDLNRADTELAAAPIPYTGIDRTWTLFLDRDGVINTDDGDYVRNKETFAFASNALKAIAALSRRFGRIIVLTNQRGVEKSLMTEGTLNEIHSFMQSEVEKAGGRIDAIYYCTSLFNDHPDRKPNPGMALKAKHQFPDIDFQKSIMVGDKLIDMQLGRNIGAHTVLVLSHESGEIMDHPDVDASAHSLWDWWYTWGEA
jgi:D-glycero-alpha-D-manno-heptose 1-phosphate guanylyltransferase